MSYELASLEHTDLVKNALEITEGLFDSIEKIKTDSTGTVIITTYATGLDFDFEKLYKISKPYGQIELKARVAIEKDKGVTLNFYKTNNGYNIQVVILFSGDKKIEFNLT